MKKRKDDSLWNDRGYSLVEILVVIAIAAILVGFASLGVLTIYYANVNKSATTFESLLTASRTTSMSKGTDAGKLILTMDDGNLYGQIGDDGEMQLICNKNVTVYKNQYYSASDYDGHDVSSPWTTGTITIEFLPSGRVKDSDDATNNICKLIFSRGTTRNFEIILYRETGKHARNSFS